MASWSLAWKVWKSREKSGKVGKSLEKSGKVWKTGGLVDWSWRTFNPVQLIPHIHRATDFEYVESTLIQASWLDHPQWGWTHPGKSELPRLHTTFMAQSGLVTGWAQLMGSMAPGLGNHSSQSLPMWCSSLYRHTLLNRANEPWIAMSQQTELCAGQISIRDAGWMEWSTELSQLLIHQLAPWSVGCCTEAPN